MNVELLRKVDRPTDGDAVKRIAGKLGLSERIVELLFQRGLTDEPAVKKFLTPDPEALYDPFLMKGMREACDRIGRAIEGGEKVIVYGDYDADGVCAAAILSLYLSSCGLDVYVHIPNRVGEGYGLNVDTLERIIDAKMPDLIVTCDCGISGINEVRFALDLGVDVIVTDHHEVSGEVPECIVIDPKQSDCGYPYDMLCGAGVALKLIEALAGREKALEYTDLACVATIADLVPLTDENRLLVQLGLARLREKKNLGLTVLFGSLEMGDKFTSGDIAYKVAPRINAAGRMGDAYRAFELLTSSDVARVKKIVSELDADNDRRKAICDEMYDEAVTDLESEDLVGERAVFLSHPSWEKGITGILAARLAGDFYRPAFIMVKSGDTYKGTCRSVEGINIHELLLSCREHLVEFGGHSQAAGFSILPEKIPDFRRAVVKYLSAFPDEVFRPKAYYDLEISEAEAKPDFVRDLELLEPTGNGNPKPLFRIEAEKLTVAPCKNPAHISVTLPGGLQIFAFNYSKLSYRLLSGGKKTLVTELQTASFGSRQVKGILRTCSPSELYINDALCGAYEYGLLAYLPEDKCEYSLYSETELDSLTSDLYGTLVIAPDRESYDRYAAAHSLPMLREYMYSSTRNNFSRVIVAPSFTDKNLSLANYKRIIFLRVPLNNGIICHLNRLTKAEILLPGQAEGKYDVVTDRSVFARCFGLIRDNASLTAGNVAGYFSRLSAGDLGLKQFVFCVKVFSELGIIEEREAPYGIIIHKDVRADLTKSRLYNLVKEKVGK